MTLCASSAPAQPYPAADSQDAVSKEEEMAARQRERAVILYMLDISGKTTERVQEIFDNFNSSDMDYESAIAETSILMNEYNKAINILPQPLPRESKKLHELMRRLLSQIERYFMFYKRAGREDQAIDYEIFSARNEIMREAHRLQMTYI
jgi:hypothetical protein